MQVPKSIQNFCKFNHPLCQPNTEAVFQFGHFKLNEAERLLLCRDQPVEIKAKDFDVLLVLLKHQPGLVTRQELLAAVWPDSFVEEANLAVHVAQLRKLLRRHTTADSYIQTVHKHGYRFVGQVTLSHEPDSGRRKHLYPVAVARQLEEMASPTDTVAEAVLMLGGGLRIEAWRSPHGAQIKLAVPSGLNLVRPAQVESFAAAGLQLSAVDCGHSLDITVLLDFKLP